MNIDNMMRSDKSTLLPETSKDNFKALILQTMRIEQLNWTVGNAFVSFQGRSLAGKDRSPQARLI